MSRFNHLEFAGEFESQPAQQRPVVKDESYYWTEASGAFQQGRFEQALRAYAKVLEYNPDWADAWSGQVRMLIELGEFKEAALWADKALERFPTEAELLGAKAVALARLGDLKAALVFSDNAVEAKGDKPYVWLARGDVLLARGEKRADYCFEKALGLAAGDWLVPWLASRVYAFYRQFARGLKLAQAALDLQATRAVVWLQLGICQRGLGLLGAAQNSFLQATQLDPECGGADAALAELARAGFWARLASRWRQLFRT